MPRNVVVPVVLDSADHRILRQCRDIDVRLPGLRVLEERMLFEIAPPTLGKSSMFRSVEVLIAEEEDFPFEESSAEFRNHGIRQTPPPSRIPEISAPIVGATALTAKCSYGAGTTDSGFR